MKTPFILGIVTVLVAASPCLRAQQAPATTEGSQAGAAPADTAHYDQQLADVQASMKKMQEEMDRIRQTKDPSERQRLMQAHMASMQATMGMMRGMMSPGMMSCCAPGRGPGANMMGGPMMGRGGMMGGAGQPTPEQMQQRHQMMEQMMGMQQMMMQHMLDYQQMTQPPVNR